MLEIKNLHVKFHTRQREAVAGVSLTIHDGEILGLVGESGSGKSVTAMSVAGLLPRKQCGFSGEILLDGVELLHADRRLLRQVQGKDIGVVFQEPMSAMDPLMRIGLQVEEVLRIHTDLSREERRRRALAALAAAFLNAFWPLYRAGPRSGYLDEYRRRQVLTGQRVLVTPRRGTPRAAQVQGIDDECKLVVRFDGESRPAALNSGEVSVRLL